jgi:multisubunit Na+/H+ antiporter MnhB subunit
MSRVSTLHLAQIADRLESQSVLMIECTIPPDATIAQWRRSSAAPRFACSHRRLPSRSEDHVMSYLTNAALPILVGIAAVVAVIWLGSVAGDVVGGLVVAAALVMFTRAVIRLSGDSGDDTPTTKTAR